MARVHANGQVRILEVHQQRTQKSSDSRKRETTDHRGILPVSVGSGNGSVEAAKRAFTGAFRTVSSRPSARVSKDWKIVTTTHRVSFVFICF